ncbi:MAG: hypothetical protein EOP51_11055 [Sphingobacteriales bacterium]|nr:MAG: hypothetical protein EOP51_11055 [Sphingobacteriales bacterium]
MGRWIAASIVVILIVVTGYVYWYYYNPYSDGYREGVLQKFSRKGNVFKTHEGEMIQLGFGQRGAAINSQYYYFSVDDEALADTLERTLGKIIRVHYTQYRRNLPWRGESYDRLNSDKGQYVVDQLAEVRMASY